MAPGKRKQSSVDDDSQDPNEKHRIANRLAQRAFRERKDNRIKELELQVEALLAQQQQKPEVVTTPPASVSNEIEVWQRKSQEMETVIAQLRSENADLKVKLDAALASANSAQPSVPLFPPYQQPSSSISTAAAAATTVWDNGGQINSVYHGLSAVSESEASITTRTAYHTPYKLASASELYGIPPVESFRNELKALPSLKDCASVDLLMDLFIDQTQYTDAFTIRKRIFAILKHKSKILDACNILDRLKAIEIIERAKKFNQVHVDHMYSHWDDILVNPATLLEVDETNSPLQMNTFYQVIDLIPSLEQRKDLIRDMHKLFVAMMTATDCVERVKLFFSLADIKNKVFAACNTDEDRNRLALALELGRQGNRSYVDDMFEQVEAVLERPPLF
ncbi:UNVERIFIED_CONTAM: hypothetical protein HDU68_005775 [Siphonaria sp. JEL0065]|nr:hypothetical protein HDU68_005775 [Siphonaria sp. JEL0065]